MGIRMDQFIGLNERARKLIREPSKCSECGQFKIDNKIPGKYKFSGMFDYDEETLLPGYTLKDGSKAYEKVQCAPWSSGPVIFTLLIREDDSVIEESVWDEKEMRENL